MHKKEKNEFILLYQMGKVASRSIEKSLINAGYNVWSPHVLKGVLNRQLFKYKRIYKYIGLKGMSKRIIKKLANNKKIFLLKRAKPLKIISLVREPISRNVSMFFQNIHIPLINIANSVDIRKQENSSINVLITEFFNKFNSHHGIEWFDRELKAVFNVDVYNYDFDKMKGYTIINQDNISLLIIKLEMLELIGDKIIGDFIGNHNIKIQKTNTANVKWYSRVYNEFNQKIEYSDEYLDSLYNSKYMKHFYSEKEIKEFREKFKKCNKGGIEC